MSKEIHITGAGAGTGKTYRLCEIVSNALDGKDPDGKALDTPCRPGGFIATTFTRKAASELTERVREKLLVQKNQQAALRVEEALVGTVHSVCLRILERFAYEAGISPRLRVMDEAMENTLLSTAIEECLSLEEISQMEHLGQRLEQQEKNYTSSWKKQVRNFISSARSNQISPADFEQMGEQSTRELLAYFPTATASDLDADLDSALEKAIFSIQANGDSTGATKSTMKDMRETRRELRSGRLKWSTWWKLAKAVPGAKSRSDYQPVSNVASRVDEHPKLQDDLKNYIKRIHQISADALAIYRRHKEERGMLDYSDLEVRTLEILDNPEVCKCISDEYDLLVVDEFQDTSPMQLALFMKLAELVKKTHWVGDTKQAIYGFRGCDPRLMESAEKAFRIGDKAKTLKTSYRHRPELVAFFNSLFPEVFAKTKGIDPDEVKLIANRTSNDSLPPAVELWHLQSNDLTAKGQLKHPNNTAQCAAVAHGIRQLIKSGMMISDKYHKDTLRALRHGDIAVLCRTNDHATDIANQIQAIGIPASRRTSGLLSTPEAGLALACLHWLADNQDSLAAAEILALELGKTIDQWLQERLEWLGSEKNEAWAIDQSPLLKTLSELKDTPLQLSPAELLDVVIARGGLAKTVSQWEPTRASQRRANLEALRGMAIKYQNNCQQASTASSHSGFLVWCETLKQKGEDVCSVDASQDAIQVLTWHASKGLEWPVVICLDLDSEPRPRIWDQALENSPQNFKPDRPLEGRSLRFWPYPFGGQQKDIPLLQAVSQSDLGKTATAEASFEESRLHYVVMTRARDLLVFPVTEKIRPWLPEGVSSPFFSIPEDEIEEDDLMGIRRKIRRLKPVQKVQTDTMGSASWFESSVPSTDIPPADLTPSGLQAVPVKHVESPAVYGKRLTIPAGQSDAALGDAFHASLACYLHHPEVDAFESKVQGIFQAHGVEADIVKVCESIECFHAFITDRFKPNEILVEVPFTNFNPEGQRITGFIDLALLTDQGVVVIDHKSYQGIGLEERAVTYSGQLTAYKAALESVGRSVASCWINWCSQGAVQEVTLD